jgi:hypothetical protein
MSGRHAERFTFENGETTLVEASSRFTGISIVLEFTFTRPATPDDFEHIRSSPYLKDWLCAELTRHNSISASHPIDSFIQRGTFSVSVDDPNILLFTCRLPGEFEEARN